MARLLEKPEIVSNDHILLKIAMPGVGSFPGQFLNIKTTNSTDPLLRRPFSIFNHHNDVFEIIVRIVGRGTRLLSGIMPGEIDVLGPLGSGFTIAQDKRVLIIGGGVGNAPLYYLASELKKKNNVITYIYGQRRWDNIYLMDKYKEISHELLLTTEDGSAGRKGTVIDEIKALSGLETYDMIYTCGPLSMMRNIIEIIKGDIPIELSLENYFGCGIGVCSGCTVNTKSGLRRACVDGPVFNGRNIDWQDLFLTND